MNSYFKGLLVLCLILISNFSISQIAQNIDTLKKLSIEELMNVEIEVTSVSKRPEKLSEVASAIQVITREDIQRSAATSLPEALRLASNLQVAQLNSYANIISSRGFNALFANKLLIMIDGRTVYSPLFAGVLWDAQSVLLEDIERIEVISGPGGAMWGANAVNGVINIITRSAEESRGIYVSAASGSFLEKFGAARYGGKIGPDFSYRIYAQHSERDNTLLPDGQPHSDHWNFSQTGFRFDWNLSDSSALMTQGNAYRGFESTSPGPSTFDGQNVLGRWTHIFSGSSDLIVQAYFDRTWRRDIPSTLSDELYTWDIEFQHRLAVKERHTILWGGGYRFMQNHIMNSTIFVGFIPARRDMHLFSIFAQDDIMLMRDRLKFTIGSKLQHNVYTGFEIQPNVRIAWTPDESNTVWGAISRAVRTPSRIDVDYFIPAVPVTPGAPNVAGGPDFVSETVIAYELGYRVHPTEKLSLSLATFYNIYDDLYSVDSLPGTLTYQIMNRSEGRTSGVEISGNFQLLKNWRLRAGYTFFYKDLENKPGSTFDLSILGNDAAHQALVHSILNLPGNLEFDVVMRYLSELPEPNVPAYFTFDTRLAWNFNSWGELSVAGQNPRKERHREFGRFEIPRSFYGRITCRF